MGAQDATSTAGSRIPFIYTARFQILSRVAGAIIRFTCMLNNRYSQTAAGMTVGVHESKTFALASFDFLLPDPVYPGAAIVIGSSPNAVISPAMKTRSPVISAITGRERTGDAP